MKRQGNKVRWLSSYAVGLLADQAYYLSLSWYAANLTSDPVIVGAVMGIGSLPRALLLLPGGILADRFGARQVASLASALKALVLFGAFLGAAQPNSPTLAGLTITAVLVGALDALFLPAIQSMPWVITTPSQVPMVQKQFSVVQRCGVVLGPTLAGLMLADWSTAAVYVAISACFALSAVILRTVAACDTSHEPDPASIKGTLDALFHLIKRPAPRAMLTLVAIAELVCSGAFSTGITLLTDSRGWGAAALGVLVAIYGAGSIGGASAALLYKGQRTLRAISGICMALMGAALVFVALAPSLELAAAGICLSGLGAGAVSTFLTASYLGEIEPGEGGRSMAILSLASFGTASISSFICGAIAQSWGASSIFIVFGLSLIAIATWAARCKALCIQV